MMDEKTKWIVGGLGVGVLIFLLLKRGGASAGGATIYAPEAPDTSALTAARAQAFGALAELEQSFGLADRQSARDITLAQIQADADRYRTDAAARVAELAAQNQNAAIAAGAAGRSTAAAGQFIRDVGEGVGSIIRSTRDGSIRYGSTPVQVGPRYDGMGGPGVVYV